MKLKIWPWENNVEPFWINPDNGLYWFVDEDLSKYCIRETINNLTKLEAICFFVVEFNEETKKYTPISRALICKNTNDLLEDTTSMEAMACKIDILRLAKTI